VDVIHQSARLQLVSRSNVAIPDSAEKKGKPVVTLISKLVKHVRSKQYEKKWKLELLRVFPRMMTPVKLSPEAARLKRHELVWPATK